MGSIWMTPWEVCLVELLPSFGCTGMGRIPRGGWIWTRLVTVPRYTVLEVELLCWPISLEIDFI